MLLRNDVTSAFLRSVGKRESLRQIVSNHSYIKANAYIVCLKDNRSTVNDSNTINTQGHTTKRSLDSFITRSLIFED